MHVIQDAYLLYLSIDLCLCSQSGLSSLECVSVFLGDKQSARRQALHFSNFIHTFFFFRKGVVSVSVINQGKPSFYSLGELSKDKEIDYVCIHDYKISSGN